MTNLVSGFIDSAQRTARAAEIPDADWDGGANYAGSNAPAVGAATGVFNFKNQDFGSESMGTDVTSIFVDSQQIGGTPSGVFVADPTFGNNSLIRIVEASAGVAIDGVIVNIDGYDFYNRTGEALFALDWTFGVAQDT